jgi:hypothetical protein
VVVVEVATLATPVLGGETVEEVVTEAAFLRDDDAAGTEADFGVGGTAVLFAGLAGT